MTLIERLSKLDGPDRDCDAAVFRYLAGNPTDHWFSFGEDNYTNETVPHVTASVDAAIALADRVLPGWNANLEACSLPPMSDTYKADLFNQNGDWRHCIGEGATPAIALCTAILRAKEASHGE